MRCHPSEVFCWYKVKGQGRIPAFEVSVNQGAAWQEHVCTNRQHSQRRSGYFKQSIHDLWLTGSWTLNRATQASVGQWGAKIGEENQIPGCLSCFLIYLPYGTNVTFLKHFGERPTNAVGWIHENLGKDLWSFGGYCCQHRMQMCLTHAEFPFTQEVFTTFNFRFYFWKHCVKDVASCTDLQKYNKCPNSSRLVAMSAGCQRRSEHKNV